MPELRSPFSFPVDRNLRFVGPFILFLTGIMFFRLKMYIDLPGNLLLNQVLIALTAGYTGWELARITAIYIQLKRPGLKRMSRRIFLLVLAWILLSHLGYGIRTIAHIIADKKGWSWPTLYDYSSTTGVVLFYNIVILGMYEGAYLWQQWKQAIVEKEQLIRSEWQAKYDLLKAQINPHFLFNSLNSLSSLIAENPLQAEKFTDEMSKVYRYLLRSNDYELVSLDAELQFLRSYCHLLTTRHGGGFRLNIDVDTAWSDYLLPSLTMQLLLENAVKHNALSKQHPLIVSIRKGPHHKLLVENNIQKKNITVLSNGVGLANINSKFRLLGLPGIAIHETSSRFVVAVPLIKTGK